MTYPQVLLRSEQSSGRIGVIESVMPPGVAGRRLHKHDFDEAFFVLEGELTFCSRRACHGGRGRARVRRR